MLGESLDPRRASILQKLVAHSVVGMREEDVVVTSLGADNGIGPDGNVYPDAFPNEYYKTRVAYEQYKKQSILNALRDIPGVRVEVNADLDNTVQETTQNLKPDKTGTASSGHGGRRILERHRRRRRSAGHHGARPQSPRHPPPTASPSSEQDVEVDRADEQHRGPGTIRSPDDRLHAEGRLGHGHDPRSYVETIWKQRNPDATAPPKDEDLRLVQEDLITKVENIVVPLLTRQNKGEDQYKQVRVAIVDSLPLPEIVPPTFASNATAWIGNYWSTLAMLGVAMFSLLVLKSVVKGAPAGSGPLSGATPTLTVHSEDSAGGGGSGGGNDDPDSPQRSRLAVKKGASLKDELADIVREDPQAAAAILKSWIGKAS